MSRVIVAAVLVAAALGVAAGCTTQEELLRLPTLAEVEPTGPRGKKCYDRCAQSEMSCRHMCPKSQGLCQEDCVVDTKFCLLDCPELVRPEPPPAQ